MENLDKALQWGFQLLQKGKNEEALDLAREKIKQEPSNANAYVLAGDCNLASGNFEESIQCYRKALTFNPRLKEAMIALAIALRQKEDILEAVKVFYDLWNLDRTQTDILLSMGELLVSIAAWEEAEEAMKIAIKINPRLAKAHALLGRIAREKHSNFEEAIEHCNRALDIDPYNISAYDQMGTSLLRLGAPWNASEKFKKILDMSDQPLPLVYSNWLFCQQYLDDTSPKELLGKHCNWQRYCTLNSKKLDRIHFGNDPDPEKKLKVGFTSADFRRHPVYYFLNGLFESYDRTKFEFICFSNLNPAKEDDMTAILKSQVDGWHAIDGMDTLELQKKIIELGIDILVDLSGHTSKNSLLIYALRSAPVQVSWLGYPDTTGLDSMDYRLVDSITDPRPQADQLASEQLYRLPLPFLCYRPDEECRKLNPEPLNNPDKIVFGTFNEAAKFSPSVIRVWSKILKQIPQAELVIKCTSFVKEKSKEYIVRNLSKHGIKEDRIKLLAFIPSRTGHMTMYNHIDIALDTFPYNGTTTTCEALWMGVPVITKEGKRHSARVGMSILKAVGLEDWITISDQEYVAKAVEMANNREKLIKEKKAIRKRIQNSPLCDSVEFARKFESALRQMWNNWCDDTTFSKK